MTTSELAALYNVSVRSIRYDCEAKIYPCTVRSRNCKGTPTYKIQSFVAAYPREVWRRVKVLPPTLYGQEEREAYVLAYNSLYSIRDIARTLRIDRMEVRRIMDILLSTGKVDVAYDLKPDKTAI